MRITTKRLFLLSVTLAAIVTACADPVSLRTRSEPTVVVDSAGAQTLQAR